MINFAHRGASNDYPENTLLAFENAIKIGATGIELDVHKTKDNILVVIHDEDVERTFLGKGLIKDFNFNDLLKLRNRRKLFEDNEKCRIPTLEEVLKLVKESDVLLNIEIKNDEVDYLNIEEDTIKLVKKYNLQERVILSSFNHKAVKRCKEIDETIKTGILYDEDIENVIEYAKCLKADAIHPSIRLVTEDLIKEAKENHIAVNIYTVNNPVHMRKLTSLKVDGLFTDYPELLRDIMQNK